MALLIPFCVFLAAQRSDAEDVTANNKPANNNVDEQLHLELSLGIEHAREIDEDDRARSIAHRSLYQQPEQDHLQDLDDEPFILREKALPKDRSSVVGIPTTELAKAFEQEQEPKRSIVDRILERAPVAAITKTKDLDREMERSRELER